MSNQTFAEKLKKYADVIVQVGLNLQAGQHLVIRAGGQVEETAPLVRAVSTSAYQAGAGYVHVVWNDEDLSVVRLENAPDDSFDELPDYVWDSLESHGANGGDRKSVV